MKVRKATITTIGVSLFLLYSMALVVYSSSELDTSTTVTSVTDGDTFDTTTEGTIRLADINAPEYWANYTAYLDSKNYLISIIDGKTLYLDIDSQYVTDYYGSGNRTVCVAYIDYNSTHYLNVNHSIVIQGYAISQEFDNDFNPNDWTLYVQKQEIPEFPSWIILPIFLSVTLVSLLIKKKMDNN